MTPLTSASLSSSLRTLSLRRRDDLKTRPVTYRHQPYWTVKDPVALAYYQLRDEEHFLLTQLDGTGKGSCFHVGGEMVAPGSHSPTTSIRGASKSLEPGDCCYGSAWVSRLYDGLDPVACKLTLFVLPTLASVAG